MQSSGPQRQGFPCGGPLFVFVAGVLWHLIPVEVAQPGSDGEAGFRVGGAKALETNVRFSVFTSPRNGEFLALITKPSVPRVFL